MNQGEENYKDHRSKWDQYFDRPRIRTKTPTLDTSNIRN